MKLPPNDAVARELTPAMALMSVAVLAMAADDYWSNREIERLRLMAYTQPLFRNVPSVERFITDRMADLRAVGPEVLMDSCRKALTPALSETAYAWAVELVQADGNVSASEHSFLKALAAKLSISDALARNIEAIAVIRRRTE